MAEDQKRAASDTPDRSRVDVRIDDDVQPVAFAPKAELRHAYPVLPLGTNALKRLGEKLAAGTELNLDEAALYRSMLADAQARAISTRSVVLEFLGSSQALLARLAECEVSWRVKTQTTLVDKLRRMPNEKLPSIHDVAGARVLTGDIPPDLQRVLAGRLAQFLNEQYVASRPALVVDRQTEPQFGYRAVHVIWWPEGRPAEIQLRTSIQHAWAQLMEALADRWGRGIRYGEPVQASSEGMRDARQFIIDQMISISTGGLSDSEDINLAFADRFLHMDALLELPSTYLDDRSRQNLEAALKVNAEDRDVLRSALAHYFGTIRRILESSLQEA